MDALRRWFDQQTERDQRIVLIGAVAAALVLLLALLLALHTSVASLREQVGRKRDDLVWLRSVGPQLTLLQASAPMPMHESLVVVVDRSARAAGLGSALTGSQPSGNRDLRVRLENASFDALVTWLSQLSQQYGVQVDNATIEAASAPGTVNASLVLKSR